MKFTGTSSTLALAAAFLIQTAGAIAASDPGGDTPAQFTRAMDSFDFEKRAIDIPMRDGVKLHTVILIPKGAHHAPMLLDRTPYNAEQHVKATTPHLASAVSSVYEGAVAEGYIIVVQDIRGKYGSEGPYVMNRPVVGPLNPTNVDHSTDCWDTIDWLVKNVPESNGKVGTIGTSYDGFTVLMSLIHPHPALKVAVPINPMVDTWKGDDWFHNGAFRQQMMSYIYAQEASKTNKESWFLSSGDDYSLYLSYGSAGAYGQAMGMTQLGFWRDLEAHPTYDAFWQGQAVDKLLAAEPLKVPTMHVGGLWDQEDIYGAVHSYAAMESKDKGNDKNFLVLGPWYHGQANGDGSALGALKWDGDTGKYFRTHVLQPFLDAYLKDDAPKADIAPVTAFETGTRVWKRYTAWPQSCDKGCPSKSRNLYLQAAGKLGFSQSADSGAAYDQYVSDPAKPVPYHTLPIHSRSSQGSPWRTWLVDDQRNAGSRPDVLVYTTDVLTGPVQVSGEPIANIFASTTGTDSDWVVKLIDVYPDDYPSEPEMGGFELAVSLDIFRGRYRQDPTHPAPIVANEVANYRFALPNVNHVFLPGHRIMVQIQSSLFPVYDRNPQTYVENIFFAQPSDYKAATQRIFHSGSQTSSVELPVVEAKR